MLVPLWACKSLAIACTEALGAEEAVPTPSTAARSRAKLPTSDAFIGIRWSAVSPVMPGGASVASWGEGTGVHNAARQFHQEVRIERHHHVGKVEPVGCIHRLSKRQA